MRKIKIISMALIGVMVLLSSCKKDDPKPNPSKTDAKTYTLSRKTGYGNDWIYFSFETGKEVAGITEENRGEKLNWDIAFNKANFRTNGGLSGKGKAGVQALKETDFSKVVALPNSGYKLDEEIEITKDLSSFPPPQMKTPGSKALGKAIIFTGPPPKYTVSNNVFAVKTAAGKYVKFKVMSYYDAKGNSGILTFQYFYQPDGSVNVK